MASLSGLAVVAIAAAALLGGIVGYLAAGSPGVAGASPEVPGQCLVGLGLLDKIRDRGVLVIGTSADWPPYEYVTPEGEYAGIDIRLAEEIAKALGVELEIRDMKFAALFQAVQDGRVDMVLADVAMKPERLEAVDFTIPYRCETSKAIIVRSEDAGSYTGYPWLEGRKIGVQTATVEEELASKYFGGKAEIIGFDKVYPEMVMALKTGRIDAIIAAPDVAKIIVAMEDGIEIVDSIPYFGCSAVVVPHCAFELKKEVSKAIWDLQQSGQLDKIIEEEMSKWLEAQKTGQG